MPNIYSKEDMEMVGSMEEKSEWVRNTKGYNVVSREYGDMFEMGIVDPTKVTTNALLNAVSVATTILMTNAIITHTRVKSND